MSIIFTSPKKQITYCLGFLGFLGLCNCTSSRNYYSLPAFTTETSITVVVEIPAGTNKKYEYNKTANDFLIDKENNNNRVIDFLPYPANYGFIPSTLSNAEKGGDGDALDMLLISESLKIGTVIETVPIAILKLIDDGEKDYKIITVPKDLNYRIISAATYEDLVSNYSPLIEIIELWFLNYNKNDNSSIQGWGDEKEAMNQIKYHIKG